MYFGVYPNDEYTSDANLNNLQKDSQVWFYIKRICTASYGYGNHYEFYVIDKTGGIASFTIGNFEVLKFYTHGTYNDFHLTIELKDCRSGNLYKYDPSHWKDEIKDMLAVLRDISSYNNFEVYTLHQENAKLRTEIERLKNNSNIR